VIGTRFHQGQPTVPAGQFRLPNLQARYPVGANAGSSAGMGTFWTGGGVGELAGSYDAVMPSHNHTVPDHLHWIEMWSGGQSASHVHADEGHGRFIYDGVQAGNDMPFHYLPRNVGTDIGGPRYFSFSSRTGGTVGDHAHLVKGWSGASDRSLTSGLAGGGNQIPPGVAFNFIIRARSTA
jgi:hypothetical protein